MMAEADAPGVAEVESLHIRMVQQPLGVTIQNHAPILQSIAEIGDRQCDRGTLFLKQSADAHILANRGQAFITG